jgi:peptide deformylase
MFRLLSVPRFLRFSSRPKGARTATRRTVVFQPRLEILEGRLAPSVTPVHLYKLSDASALADAMGGRALIADGGTFSANRYVFNANQGLRLGGGLADTTNYSVAMGVSLNSLANYFNKLIDFQGLSIDQGLYVGGSRLQLYPGGPGADVVSANVDFQVVLTRDGASGVTSVYLNGVLQQAYTGPAATVAIPGNNVLTFFEDDFGSGQLEAVGGSANYIAIYDHPLSTSEIANLGDPKTDFSPRVAADQTTVTADQGQAATNTGTWANATALSASAGTVTRNADGTWSWSGTQDEVGSAPVVIRATSADGETATVSFTVSFTTGLGVTVDQDSVTAAPGETAANTGTWTNAVLLTASAGTVTQNDDGTWSWSGTQDDLGSDSTVTITATDADGYTATVSFTVSFTTGLSVTVDQDSVTAPAGQPATNTGTWANAVLLTASAGTIAQNDDGTWSWSGTQDDLGSDSTVIIAATDADGNTATVSFTVSFTNVVSVSADQASVTAPVGQTATNTGTWANAVLLTASAGSVTQFDDGTWSWSGTQDEVGSNATITITATDADGNTATVSFHVSFTAGPSVGVDQQIVVAAPGQIATNTGTWANAVLLTASAGTVTQNDNGTWSWTGTQAQVGTHSTITITAADADGHTATVSFEVLYPSD